jgi:hypothetical protein
MSSLAFRLAAGSTVFAAGIAAGLALTPEGQSRAFDCVVGICVPTTVPPLPVPVPLPVPTEPPPTTTSTAAPVASPATTPPATTSPAPAQTGPAAPVEQTPVARPSATLTGVQVAVIGRGARRVLAVTLTLARPASAALDVKLRPRAVRATFRLRAGRNVRKVKIPSRTRAGRYPLTLTVRSAETGIQTHRRTVSVRR